MLKNLVILVCGDNSIHEKWGDRSGKYDLWIHYFGDQSGRYKDQCDYYEESKGFKYPLIFDLATRKKAEVEKYDYIFCIDDDIMWTSEQIFQAAQLMRKHWIELGQPAISNQNTGYKDLHVPWSRSAWVPKSPYDGRLVNFVEVMTPIFAQHTFQHLLWTFNVNKSSWGIDTIWSHLLNGRRMAVFDTIGVEHVRAQFKGEIYGALAKHGIDSQVEAQEVYKQYPAVKASTIRFLES